MFRTAILLGVLLWVVGDLFGQLNIIIPIIQEVPTLSISGSNQSKGVPYVGAIADFRYREAGLGFNPALLAGEKQVVGGYVAGNLYRPQQDSTYNTEAGVFFSFGKRYTIGIKQVLTQFEKIEVRNQADQLIFTRQKPREITTHLAVGYQISKKFTAGSGITYFNANTGSRYFGDFRPIRSFAVNLGMTYRDQKQISKRSTIKWNTGLSVANLGPSISYSPAAAYKEPIPSTFQLGVLTSIETQLAKNVNYEIGVSGHIAADITKYRFPLSYQIGVENRLRIDKLSIIFRVSFFDENNRLRNKNWDFLAISPGIEYSGFRVDFSLLNLVETKTSYYLFPDFNPINPFPFQHSIALTYSREIL